MRATPLEESAVNFTRESIFVNAARSFCTSFSAVLGVVIALGVATIGFMMLSGPNFLPPPSEPMVMPDAHGERVLLSGSTPAVLRIDIHGVIGMGDLTGSKIREVLDDSHDGFLRGNRVKAVLLHMDTPGGTVTDADAIYRALLEYKAKYNVPIYAFVDGLCASGGMYIISAADKVYATPVSTIGSIGVIMGPVFNFSDAMVKLGVASVTLTEGKDKDALNPFRPWKPGEDDSLRAIIVSMYDRFVEIVTKARPRLSKDKLIQDYGAHVFLAKEAQDLGYVDNGDSDYSLAVTELVQTAGLGEQDKYQVVLLSPPRPFFPEFIQGMANLKNGKMTHTLELNPYLSSELSGKLLYLYVPGS